MKNGYREYSMITEYGAQGVSSKKILEQMLEPEDLKFPSTKAAMGKWIYGNFQPNPCGMINYIDKKQEYSGTSDGNLLYISKGKNINEFINNSQTYQAAITKFFTEKQRQLKDQPSTGVFDFAFTDNWPSLASKSKLDWNRTPKKSFFALKEAMQPLLPSIRYDITNPDASIGITIVNDFHKDLHNHTLNWQAGDEEANSELIKNIKSDSVIDLPDIGCFPEVTKGTKQLKIWISDSNGKIVAKNNLCKEHFIPEIKIV